MKNILLFIITSCVFIFGYSTAKGQQLILSDTTWSSDTIRVYNDVIVQYPATLSINPGVYIEFQGNYSLSILGGIKAIGTESDSIIFTVNNYASIDDTTTSEGGWGGIKLLSNDADTAIFKYCRFSYGKAVVAGDYWGDPENEENKGGAIYLYDYAHLRISNSLFYHNRSNYSGGGMVINNCNTAEIYNNHFKYNFTHFLGGGIFIEESDYSIVSGNLFTYNTAFYVVIGFANGVGSGIAVYCNTTIINNRFFSNNSVNGALYESSYNSIVANNILANNLGTGMVVGGSDLGISKVSNNIIVNNESYSPNGCGILFYGDAVKMRNNIVTGNTFYVEGFHLDQVYTPLDVKADFAYSCNPDEPIYYEGVGNIQDDPLFVNPTTGAGSDYDGLSADWSLLDSSPCVNTGTPDISELNLPDTDILGNPRVYGIRIDMGAIENQMVVGLPKNPLVNASLQISPNPFGQRFKVVSPAGQKISSISLYNKNGKLLGKIEKLPFDQLMVYDLANQSAGLYLMVTQFENGNVESTKLVKY